jgi:hypothetical protein
MEDKLKAMEGFIALKGGVKTKDKICFAAISARIEG